MTKLMEIELVITDIVNDIASDIGHGDLTLITKSYKDKVRGDERY